MLWTAVLCLAQITDYSALARQNPHTTAADLARGQRTFMGQCAGCHGPRGEGAKGPPLNRGSFEHAENDFQLFRVIRGGIPGTEMPSAIQISDKEIWQTVTFVRSFASERGAATGDAVQGAALYKKNGCAGCHLVDGQGTPIGPDLSGIGLKRSPAHLRESIAKPAAEVLDQFLPVSYVAPGGAARRAVRMNEDSFSVRVNELGTVKSYWKKDLRDYRVEHGASAMPDYALAEKDLEDLVAYLSSLRRKR